MSDGEDAATTANVADNNIMEEDKPLDILSALSIVVQRSNVHNGLARGLRETVKAIESHQAHLVILAEDCSQESYKSLIQALTREAEIYFLTVPSRSVLGEWAGLYRRKKSGKVKKICASVVAIRNFGEKTEALDFVTNYIKSNKA